MENTKPFSVNLWGSHPDEGNDDCHTGLDFATEAEARSCMANLAEHFNMTYYHSSTPFVELDGPGVNEIVKRPGVKRAAQREDASDRSEHAMQMGMAFGCAGYNEAMGYD